MWYHVRVQVPHQYMPNHERQDPALLARHQLLQALAVLPVLVFVAGQHPWTPERPSQQQHYYVL